MKTIFKSPSGADKKLSYNFCFLKESKLSYNFFNCFDRIPIFAIINIK